jgi:hypothetical protein
MLVLSMASLAAAGEIFGTIVDGSKVVPENTKVEVTVAGKIFTGTTDKTGTYHVFALEKGKGTLTAYYKDQKPTADVFSFEKATRYDYVIETADGKMMLKRK